MNKINLIGKKFGKLLVTSQGNNVYEGKNKKSKITWNCLCDCGNTIIVKSYHLKNNRVNSCGCLRIKFKSNQKFNKLTTISYTGKSIWLCQCECGSFTLIKTDKLGKTKSCGCIKKEISNKNIKNAIAKRIRYSPTESSARRIWQSYCRIDKCTTKNPYISFEDFYLLSQNNCFYCGSVPSNRFNIFCYGYYKNKNIIKNDGLFIYNGLDRINNNKPHTKDNCVSCCIICNRAKNNRSIEEFNEFIKKLRINNSYKEPIDKILLNNKIKQIIKNNWKRYKDGLTLNQFYILSQLPCYYCGEFKSNQNCYNGIDRIDSSKDHSLNNVVPCCKFCNFAKSNLSINEFNDWILRIKTYQTKKAQ